MRFFGSLLAVTLGACAFSSAAPFFTAADASHPFADGARMLWRAEDEIQAVRFVREGAHYRLVSESDPGEDMTGILIVAIPETLEEDYVLQLRPREGDGAYVYAFMWRVGEEYRVVQSPSAVLVRGGKPSPRTHALCTWRAFQECALSRREDWMRVYLEIVYPDFVQSEQAPDEFMALTPRRDGERP